MIFVLKYQAEYDIILSGLFYGDIKTEEEYKQ